jgi:hypothetical protein
MNKLQSIVECISYENSDNSFNGNLLDSMSPTFIEKSTESE